MAKLLLLSIIIASIALPAKAAKERSPNVGLKKTVIYLAVFNLLYILALRFIYMHLV
jgi:hypothetical protein